MAKKLSKLQSFSANFKILGDFWKFFTKNHNYEFFQKGGLLRFDGWWSSYTSDALDQTPPPVLMGQTLFYFFGSREVWSDCDAPTYRDAQASKNGLNLGSMFTFMTYSTVHSGTTMASKTKKLGLN